MNNKHKAIIAFTATVCTAALFFGVSHSTTTLTHCNAAVTRYTVAQFEQDYSCMSMDYEGDLYADTCTNYWTKPASTMVTFNTYDGNGKGHFFEKGYFYGYYPEISVDFTSDAAFAGYVREHDVVIERIFDNGDRVRAWDYLGCLVDINKSATITYLFGFPLYSEIKG